MANIIPFRAYRYTAAAGAPLTNLVTQPYDKISPAMRADYLRKSPYNLVRIILGEPAGSDSASDNVYTRAATYLTDWIRQGILAADDAPGFYPYSQEFADLDTGETLTRKGLIALGEVTAYSEGIVHRHEETLSGPKKDRLALLNHAKAHFGQIFMLYEDAAAAVDQLVDRAAGAPPLGEAEDEYGVRHRLWRITDPATLSEIHASMADKQLIIADGHHRYETALNYRRENGGEDARFVMMTLVNMRTPGLRILATHRVLHGVAGLDRAKILGGLAGLGELTLEGPHEFRARLARREESHITLGVALPGEEQVHVLRAARAPGELDVSFLHEKLFAARYGITAETVRDHSYIDYVRGAEAAMATAHQGRAQAAFLLQATRIDEVSAVVRAGGVMPQKSTDFYPKLLSGMTVYKLGG